MCIDFQEIKLPNPNLHNYTKLHTALFYKTYVDLKISIQFIYTHLLCLKIA
jgi:hypothetical protein